MKKLFTSIIVLIMALVVGTNTTYAINVEKIAIDENMLNLLDAEANEENVETNVDTTNLMYSSQPIFGNGVYLQFDNSWGAYPEHYKPAGLSNSPLYIYDREFNLIKTVEFDNYMMVSSFNDGYFYGTKAIYGNGEVLSYNRVKTKDGESFAEISEKEFTYATNAVTLYNGERYTYERYTYEQDGTTYTSLDILEYLVNSYGEVELIKREDEKCVDTTKVLSANNMKIHVMLKKDIKYFSERCDKEYKYISIDGLSMVQLPDDANLYDVWNDDKSIYIGIEDNESDCYKVKIDDISNFIKIKYRDTYLSFTTPPVTESDRTLVPMRFLFEQMGAEVEWDESTQTATVNKDGESISFSIDNTSASVNGELKTMDVPARLVNDKTMIPVRFLSEELGYTVGWDEATKTVTIENY